MTDTAGTKRVLLGTAAALAMALAGGAAAAEGKIVISNWDGYMPADLLERFTAETGIEAELAVHATNEEIMGKWSPAAARATTCSSSPRPSPRR